MSEPKVKRTNPKMDGNVNRAVDFSLKKEDLMLLILEGRKEVMEEQIGKLQAVSTGLRGQITKAQDSLRKKVEGFVKKSLSAEAKKLTADIKEFKTVTDDDDDDDDDMCTNNEDTTFKIRLFNVESQVNYTSYQARPIGDGKGSAYIKTPFNNSIAYDLYYKVKITVNYSLNGKCFANKADIYQNKTSIRACTAYAQDFTILEEYLDTKFQETLPEGIVLKSLVVDLSKNEALLSDILAEYDLFNRNQPRSKAKMIKEVLGRDEAGQALLNNITDAAVGTKLLG